MRISRRLAQPNQESLQNMKVEPRNEGGRRAESGLAQAYISCGGRVDFVHLFLLHFFHQTDISQEFLFLSRLTESADDSQDSCHCSRISRGPGHAVRPWLLARCTHLTTLRICVRSSAPPPSPPCLFPLLPSADCAAVDAQYRNYKYLGRFRTCSD